MRLLYTCSKREQEQTTEYQLRIKSKSSGYSPGGLKTTVIKLVVRWIEK